MSSPIIPFDFNSFGWMILFRMSMSLLPSPTFLLCAFSVVLVHTILSNISLNVWRLLSKTFGRWMHEIKSVFPVFETYIHKQTYPYQNQAKDFEIVENSRGSQKLQEQQLFKLGTISANKIMCIRKCYKRSNIYTTANKISYALRLLLLSVFVCTKKCNLFEMAHFGD